jgi:hypothetical protein
VRESIGVMLYLLFIVLTVSGAALGVAAASALLHRRVAAGVDAAGVHAGSRTQLRRYGLCWLALACVWLIGASLVTRI